MDGVLWRESQPIGDLSAIFARIARQGWQVAFATNNATTTIAQYLERLRAFGVPAESWQVVTSAVAVARHLAGQHPEGGPVYIIGEAGLIEALQTQGFYQVKDTPEAYPHVLAVVAGMDRQITYAKLRRATLLIRAGAPFIATNPDRTFPTPEGLVPGAGAILAALEAATDQHPLVVGKPSPAMYQIALERLGTTPAQTLVVGDRPETDIAGAQAIGCPAALVLSGVTPPEQADRWQPPPDLVAADLAAVVELVIAGHAPRPDL